MEIIAGIIGAAVAAVLGVIGFMLQRWWTGEASKDRLDRLDKLASLYQALRDQDITPADLDRFDMMLQTRSRFEAELEVVRHEADPLRRLQEEDLPQQTMNQLAAKAAEIADVELEYALRKAESCFDGEDRDRFLASHEAWRDYRDSESGFERGIFGRGSMAPLVGALEYEAITRQRIARIRDIYQTYNSNAR